jgi:hypothetical protein
MVKASNNRNNKSRNATREDNEDNEDKADKEYKEYKEYNKDKADKDKKDKFEDSGTSYEDVIDFLSVSPSAGDKESITFQDQLKDFFIMFLKYGFLVLVLTLNFLGLSVSLNCNADEELFKRIISAIFAFFFGFVYLIINYYTYKVLSQGKICKMNNEKLFPFKV